MHQHLEHDIRIDDHPLLREHAVKAVNRAYSDDPDARDFFSHRLYFVYPRCLAVVLGVGAADRGSLEVRQVINFRHLLKVWDQLAADRLFGSLLLDYSDVSVVHSNLIDDIRSHLETLAKKKQLLVIVGPQTRAVFAGLSEPLSSCCFEDLSATVRVLRQQGFANSGRLVLSGEVTHDDLEAALKEQLGSSQLRGKDTFAVDLAGVKSLDFHTVCMLPITVHSVAHRVGCLSDLILPESRPATQQLLRFRCLRILKSYLLRIDQKWREFVDMQELRNQHRDLSFGIACFSREEHKLLQDRIEEYLDDVFGAAQNYLNAFRARREAGAGLAAIEDFKETVWELVTNACFHSGSVAYFACQYVPEDRRLRAFVGDPGCGLRMGIKRTYELGVPDDSAAIKLASTLRSYAHRRSQAAGSQYAGGGFGLDKVRARVTNLRGTVELRTGSAAGDFVNPRRLTPKVQEGLWPIDGLQVFMDIPLTYDTRE